MAVHHKLMLDSLEEIAGGTLKRLMLFMPPGSAKSTYASVVYPAWYLGKFPGHKIILASYGSDLARKHGRKARQIVRDPKYHGIFDAGLSPETHAADEWALTNGSEYLAGGILSGITGNRAHGVIIDDPVKGRQEADSEATQKATREAYEDDLDTRLIPGGWKILIQTRWNENDLGGSILPTDWNGQSGDIECQDGEVWRVICLQAKCERKDDPLGRKIGEYIWPEWFTPEHWARFEKKARTWRALFQQTPTAAEGIYFLRKWFNWYDVLPKHLNHYLSGDFAVTDDGNDFSEIGEWGVDPNDDVYITDWWFGQVESDEWVTELVERIKASKPLFFFGESGVIEKSVGPYLKRKMRKERARTVLKLFPTNTGDKATKARAFQGMAQAGQIYLPKTPWAERLVDQLCRFPTGRYDDAVDACAAFGRGLEFVWNANEPNNPTKRPKQVVTEAGIHVADLMPKDGITIG